jgi:uncharacterized membrane protein
MLRSRARLTVVAFGVVSSLALAYAAVTGPFRGADEFNHFFRAYQVSQGGILARHMGNGIVGATLPASLGETATAAAGFPALPQISTSAEQLRSAMRVPLYTERRAIANFPNTALFSPLIYLPPAIGITLGRVISAHPLVLFYFARVFSALVGAGLIAIGFHRLPAAAVPLAAFALIPMALFQMGMITADTITIALAFVCASEVLRARGRTGDFTGATRAWLLVLASLVSQLRPPYPMIGLAVLAIPAERFVDKRQARRFFALFFALLVSPFLLWNAAVPALFSQMRPGVTTNPQQQLAFIASAPRHFLAALATELGPKGLTHVHEMIGFFGWRNFPLPWPLIAIVVIALMVCACGCDPAALKLTWKTRIFFFAIAAGGFISAALMIYLMWNGPGSEEVEGFHGRYFLPFLPFALIGVANDKLKARWLTLIAVAALVTANLIAIALLFRATFF